MDNQTLLADAGDAAEFHFLHSLPPKQPFPLGRAAQAVRLLERQVLAMSRGSPSRGCGLVGMERLVRRLIQAVLLGEHCLIEGYPGLAKTLAAKTLAAMLGLSFQRIQFVPDLMPSDLIQRERLNLDGQGRAVIEWRPGPIFTNLLLADEINRASPKAQAALLEVTEERQVSPLYRPRMIVRPREPTDEAALLEDHDPSYGEPRINPDNHDGQVFVVLATMNPIEQEGVYPLSEAQIDRFAFQIVLDYPDYEVLDAIGMHAFEGERGEDVPPHRPEDHVKTLYFLSRLRRMMLGPGARERWQDPDNADLRHQVADLIEFSHARPGRDDPDANTRRMPASLDSGGDPGAKHGRVADQIKIWQRAADTRPRAGAAGAHARAMGAYAEALIKRLNGDHYPEVLTGASPRGLLKLIRAAHAEALMNGHFDLDHPDRLAPTWGDVAAVAPDVLRHRIRLSSSAVAMGMKSDTVISELVAWVATRPTTIDWAG
jgi:MoxR-like ATPase